MSQPLSHPVPALLAEHRPPCISLYQPTHRHHPDNIQDPIRYRNLLRQMQESLSEQWPTPEVQSLLEKFQALAHDDQFWRQRTDGLAILGSPEVFQLFELQRPVKELLVVADSFHAKPLLRILQSADRYQVLALSRHEVKLYEGNRDALDPVELTGVPATITEALGQELTEPHQTVASYGGAAGAPRGRHGEPAMYHGHGQKKDEIEIDMVRFFRVVDRAILEQHSRPSGLPLMLAALPEYHAPFREVSHNPFLMADGLYLNAEALSLDQLRSQAWETVQPLYLSRLAELVERFRLAQSRDAGSDDLAEIARAAMAGRVATLLVEADREIPGHVDPSSGRIEPGDLSHPDMDDLLDDLAQAVLRMKGEVVVVPTQRMPSSTGAAATFRY